MIPPNPGNANAKQRGFDRCSMYDGSHAPSREELLEYGAPTDVTFGAFKWVLNGERAGASQAHDALAEAGTDGKAVAKYACCHVHYRCWVARIDGGIDGPLEDDIGDGGNDDEDDGDEGSEVNEVCCAWLAHLVQQHSAYPAWLALALGCAQPASCLCACAWHVRGFSPASDSGHCASRRALRVAQNAELARRLTVSTVACWCMTLGPRVAGPSSSWRIVTVLARRSTGWGC